MLNLDSIAEFTWFWGHKFFLESVDGNYIWSDPEYPGGDNTIRPYSGTLDDYLKETGIPYGRDKGTHTIRGYCGDEVKILG